MATEKQKQQKQVPPYISAATFFNALNALAEHGVPQQIDRSVLNKFSGSVQRQLMQTFHYLGLTDDNDRPTDLLKAYEKADEERQKTILADVLRQRFPQQIKILPDGTLQQLQSSFDDFEIEASVRAKCIAFVLNMAKRIGLPVGKHIAKGSRVRGPRKVAKIKAKTADTGISQREKEREPETDEGMVSMPIALAPGKTWKIYVDENYSKDDVDRFLKMIAIVLNTTK